MLLICRIILINYKLRSNVKDGWFVWVFSLRKYIMVREEMCRIMKLFGYVEVIVMNRWVGVQVINGEWDIGLRSRIGLYIGLGYERLRFVCNDI